MMNRWGISILGPKVPRVKSAPGNIAEPSPSAPARLWDYPYYEEEHKTGSDFLRKASIHHENLKLLLTDLKDINIVYIEDVPDHYPYTYVVGFTFALKSSQVPADKHELLFKLTQVATKGS
jgi:hypothetical protein